MTFSEPVAARIHAMALPERAGTAPPSVRAADLQLLAAAPEGYMDTTHFDTVRFPPPDWAAEIFDAAAADGALAYTGYRGHEGVLGTVAANVARFLGHPVDADRNLCLTPGTQAALFTVLSSRIDPGDRVVVFDPDYLFTARILRFLGAEVVYLGLKLVGGRYQPDLNALEDAFAGGARHLVFSHPNNPTGAVFPKEIVSGIASLTRRYDVSVLVDELYARLIYDGVPFHHLAAEDGVFDQVATLLGPSKTESLSGYRLGVVVGGEALMQSVENVLSITSLRAPAYAQHVLTHWLGADEAWLQNRLSELANLRSQTVQALEALAWIRLAPQQGTAYLWPDVTRLGVTDTTVAHALLAQAEVMISPGYQFGPSANGHFRVCYARDERSWAERLERIVQVLDDLARQRAVA